MTARAIFATTPQPSATITTQSSVPAAMAVVSVTTSQGAVSTVADLAAAAL